MDWQPRPGPSQAERRFASSLIVALVVINQLQVAINVRLSFFNRDWFNAIQNKDSTAFWSLLFGVFCFWAAIARLDQGQSQGGGSVHLTVAE